MGIAERLADYAWDVARGRGKLIVRVLRAQGKAVDGLGDGTLIVRSEGFTCGLPLGGSPVDALANVMFALFGPLWPLAIGKEFDRAHKLIAARLKAERLGETEAVATCCADEARSGVEP